MGASRHSRPPRPQKSLHHDIWRRRLARIRGWRKSSVGHRYTRASARTIAHEPPGGKKTEGSYGRCFLVDTGGLATCADERASEGGRIIWPAGSGAKTAWLLAHAPGDLPAALDVATHLRSNDSFEGASESGRG